MKKLLVVLILSISMVSVNYAIVVSRGNKEYDKEQRDQFVLKEEVYKWRDEMQHWFDFGADEELFIKVASVSNTHGYYADVKDGRGND